MRENGKKRAALLDKSKNCFKYKRIYFSESDWYSQNVREEFSFTGRFLGEREKKKSPPLRPAASLHDVSPCSQHRRQMLQDGTPG
jgi:hypothetical protein